MEDEAGISWEKIAVLLFIIGAVIVLLVILVMSVILPMLNN